MSSSIVTPDLALPNGVVIPGTTVAQFLWADRERGLSWIAALPDTLVEWCEHWGITLDPELPPHSMNLVLFGRSEHHGPVVIKTSPPDDEITAEIDALRARSTPNIVGLIDADPSVSIMLQQRIMPGTSLRSQVEAGVLTEKDAAAIAARLMQEYWITPAERSTVFSLDRWFRALYAYRDRYPDGGGPLPHRNVTLATNMAGELLASQRDRVTLHGDLHHDNILLSETSGWTIIDPKGLVGERGYDIATWMTNPVGVDVRDDLARLSSDRLDWFSELLGIDRYRLWQWAMVHSVLSDCWNLESGEDTDLHALAIANVLAAMPEAER